MGVIIAGTGSICDATVVRKAIKVSGFLISEIASGGSKGVDESAERIYSGHWVRPGAMMHKDRRGQSTMKVFAFGIASSKSLNLIRYAHPDLRLKQAVDRLF